MSHAALVMPPRRSLASSAVRVALEGADLGNETWSPAMGAAAGALVRTSDITSGDAHVAVAAVLAGRPWYGAYVLGLPTEAEVVVALVDAELDEGPAGLARLLGSPNRAVREAALLGMAA